MNRWALVTLAALPACGGASGLPADDADSAMSSDLEVQPVNHRPTRDRPAHDGGDEGDPDTGPARGTVSPVPFRIEDLAHATIAAPLGSADPPPDGDAPSVEEARANELTVERQGQFAELRVAAPRRALTALTIATTTSDALKVRCGTRRGKAALRWEILEPLANGNARYSVVDAWFVSPSCRPRVTRRGTFEAKALVPHVLYGLRDCGASPSCDGDPRLLLLAPPLATEAAHRLGADGERIRAWPFTVVRLGVTHGGGQAFLGHIEKTALRSWLGTTSPSWARPLRDVVVGVDVVHAVDEPAPIALAHVAPDVLVTHVDRPSDHPIDFHE